MEEKSAAFGSSFGPPLADPLGLEALEKAAQFPGVLLVTQGPNRRRVGPHHGSIRLLRHLPVEEKGPGTQEMIRRL